VLDFLSPPTPPLLATFIRAPALHSLLPPPPTSSDPTSEDEDRAPPPVECLVRLPPKLLATVAPAKPALGTAATTQTPAGPMNDVVMWKQGDILASSWHPELNKDDARVHEWWVRTMVLHES
jgi:5'-phosphate synthase pdxT subunit